MGRTKRQKTATEERKLQEHDWWCFYCGEDFDDEYALREHQEAQHFTCTVCQARNTTPLELRVHSREEHQLDVLRVNNTLAGRDWVDLGVVGMDGMPDAFLGKGNKYPPGEVELIFAHLDRKQQELTILNSFSLQGVVKSFVPPSADGRQGWGFIIRDPRDTSPASGDSPQDIFVHQSELAVPCEGEPKTESLVAGQRVYYATKEDLKYGTQAANVRPVLAPKNFRAAADGKPPGAVVHAPPVPVIVTSTGSAGQAIVKLAEPQVSGTIKSFSAKDKWGFIVPDGGVPPVPSLAPS
jgi:cold shock CspA family protein